MHRGHTAVQNTEKVGQRKPCSEVGWPEPRTAKRDPRAGQEGTAAPTSGADTPSLPTPWFRLDGARHLQADGPVISGFRRFFPGAARACDVLGMLDHHDAGRLPLQAAVQTLDLGEMGSRISHGERAARARSRISSIHLAAGH